MILNIIIINEFQNIAAKNGEWLNKQVFENGLLEQKSINSDLSNLIHQISFFLKLIIDGEKITLATIPTPVEKRLLQHRSNLEGLDELAKETREKFENINILADKINESVKVINDTILEVTNQGVIKQIWLKIRELCYCLNIQDQIIKKIIPLDIQQKMLTKNQVVSI